MRADALMAFDLKGAAPRVYDTAYSICKTLGLSRVHKTASGGDFVIPTTTVMGTFDGVSKEGIRDWLREKVKAAFAAAGITAEIFVFVGIDTTWGATTTS